MLRPGGEAGGGHRVFVSARREVGGARACARVGVSRTPRQGRGGFVRVGARRWGGPKPLAREIRPAGEEGREFQARVRERSLGTCARCSAVRAPSPALLIGTWSSSVF